MTLFQRAEELRKRLNKQLEEKGAFGTAAIVAALQEQDKITRHACAEAMMIVKNDSVDSNAYETLRRKTAHDVCINVKME